MNIKRLAMIAVLALSSTPGLADTAKCKPDITIKNTKSTAVKVIRLEYLIENGGNDWKSEGLGNRVLDKNGGTSTWNSQTLDQAVEGILITKTRVIYQDDTGRGWSSNKTGGSYSHKSKCSDSANYHQDVP